MWLDRGVKTKLFLDPDTHNCRSSSVFCKHKLSSSACNNSGVMYLRSSVALAQHAAYKADKTAASS